MRGEIKTCVTVSLRKKAITQGRSTLYLDFYPAIRNPRTMKMTRREFLGIYIYDNPNNAALKEYNEEMLKRAEILRCRRQMSIMSEEYGFLDNYKLKEDALAYFKKLSTQRGDKYPFVYAYFEQFTGGHCCFGDITVELCKKFCLYLQSAKSIRHPNKHLCNNSVCAYWRGFRAMLRQAYLEKYFKENLNDYLDRIEEDDVHKEFLTLEELHQLAATPCRFDVLKRASLFSCLTGLRISDILNLDWASITPASDGGHWIRIKTIKTGTEATLPISEEALELCGEPGTGKVFKGLKRPMTQTPLKKWLLDAGITKHITFHCFRHTYATLQIAAGTDIYTVSKMLTHRNVTTTQIYADLVSTKKRETVNRISLK